MFDKLFPNGLRRHQHETCRFTRLQYDFNFCSRAHGCRAAGVQDAPIAGASDGQLTGHCVNPGLATFRENVRKTPLPVQEAIKHRHFFRITFIADGVAAASEKDANAVFLALEHRSIFGAHVERTCRFLLQSRRQIDENLKSVCTPAVLWTLLVSGVFTGSMSWWLLITALVGSVRSRTSPQIVQRLSPVSGVLIAIFGFVLVATAIPVW